MDRTFTKSFLLAIFTLFTLTGVYAQTVTVGTVDPGPYGRGSTITVPITINDAGGCIDQSNTFNLFLSDASGNFTPGTLIGSYAGFYTPFVNGVIPAGTPAGTGYKVRVQSTNPATTSAASAAFEVKAVTGVTASASSNKNVAGGVFGQCVGAANSPFVISNTSAAGTTVTASFFNTQTQSFEATDVPIPTGGYTFNAANTTTYTVIVKTTDASGTVGTFQYQLINNPVHQNIGSAGNNFVCLVNNQGDLSFSIDISALSAGGIGANYLGDTYVLDWGDGTSTTFTYCQLKALGGVVTHTFTLPSCGKTAGNGDSNAFYVTNSPISPYCGQITAAPGVSAKVIIKPTTSFAAPSVACVGTALTIPNTSDPGPDYSLGATSTCLANPGALYDWKLDGVPVVGYQGVLRSKSFIFPATTTAGNHVLELDSELPASGVGCQADPYIQTICFENPPQPVFSMPAEVCINSGPVIPTNTSTIDAFCGVDTYTWITTGPQPVTYAGGTNANSEFPKFVFPVAGVYTVQLGINSGGCGLIKAAVQTIRVDDVPTASLSPDITICGNNLSFTFDPSQTVTKTILTGTAQTQADTYTWDITGGVFSFTGGTNQNSQYPKILFADFAAYTIKVTHKNSCGTITKTQMITFVQAPTVDAGIDQNICASNPAAPLTGSITGTYTSFQWTGGTGTFSAGRNSLTTTYTPSNAEITAGQVTLTLQANTALPAPCDKVTDDIVINITPTAFITSPPTAELCSGQPLNYTITANNNLATFAWTALVSSGTVTGFTASGTSANLNDVLTNTGNVDGVLKYDILPTIGSCPGTPFVLTVTVHPLPVLTVPPTLDICNNQAANVTLSSNVANTTYTWTSTADADITGNTNQPTVLTTNSIQDVLNNSGTVAETVTYTITPYNGTCPGTPVTSIVTVQPTPKASIPGPDQEICSTAPYTLQGNDPAPFTGKWTQIDANPAVTFSDNTKFNAVVTGLVSGNIYKFQWTITASASCPTSSNVVTITVDTPPVGGIAAANPADICLGSNTQVNLTGQLGSVVQWETSIDNATWSLISNTTASLVTPVLTQTTYYRALIHNGNTCTDVYSAVATVTVHPPPTIAIAGPNDEICNSAVYTLQGNAPTSGTGLWTQGINNPAGATFVNAGDPNTQINGLAPGTYTFIWTITASATCPPSTSSVTIKVDSPPIGGIATALPTEVCKGDGSQLTLTGQFGTIVEWQTFVGGTWQGIPNSANNPILSVTNLTQTTQYRVRLSTGNTCPDVFSTVATVTVDEPPTVAVAGPDDEVCNSPVYTLQGNTPASGTGKWTQDVSNPAGATFANITNPNTTVSGLAPGVYRFIWTITASATCPSSTSTVKITIDAPPVGGTTAGIATVCSGDNNGQIALTGQVGTVKQWQSSTDGVNYFPLASAGTGTTMTYTQLTQTTFYRAVVTNGTVCPDVFSTPTKITVNPTTPLANAGPDQGICNQNYADMVGNDPGPLFSGVWTQTLGPAVTIVNPNDPHTRITGLTRGSAYTFKWTIIGLAPCGNTEDLVDISATSDVVPSFTMDQNHNCGNLSVNFTNTSTPSPTGTFVWDFGDGSPVVTAVNPPPHTFPPSTDGTEKTYRITLTPISNCGSQAPYQADVTVSPAVPVASMSPNQASACGTFALKVENHSPGDNAKYDYYLKDAGGTVVQHISVTDKNDVTFQPIVPTVATNYTITLTVTDKCGNQVSTVPQIISVSPSTLISQIQIKGGIESVCLGNPVTFQNISTGGDRFTIKVYDSGHNLILTLPAGTGETNYTPTAAGNYYVTITAGNEGCGDAPASAERQFTVYPVPQPNFTYTSDKDYNITFTNTTPNDGNIPASSVLYSWNFGDGSPNESSYTPNKHRFDYAKSPFTVTLTATTPGSSCSNITTQTINVKFLGNLFLPNAFIPTSSNNQLKTYMAKGFGMKTWKMQIFNNFGQLIWETTKLDNNGAPVEGWDGTYKGQIVEQGVYIWQITATLLNGEDWKGMSYNNSSPSRTGAIHLIR